jgi:hypothetical protein
MKYRNELRFNIIFWLVYFMYEWLANASVADEYRRYLINASVIVPLTFLAVLPGSPCHGGAVAFITGIR